MLPNELLATIFKYAVPRRSSGLHSRGYQQASHKKDMLSRLPLTHVCRRWRFVALATITLWTVVDQDFDHLRSLFLDRSANASIAVLARYGAGQMGAAHIAPHALRIIDLHLIYPPSSKEFGLQTTLPVDVPNLQCLTLSSSGTTGRNHIDLGTLEQFFPHRVPSLRRLALWRIRRLPDVPYEQLTHLFIGHGNRLPIIGLLRRCPALQHLALIDAAVAGLPTSDDENDNVQVELPSLRVLTMGTYKNPIAAENLPRLLPVLALPNNLTLRLVGPQATTFLSSNDFDLHRMPSMSNLSVVSIDLRVNGHCVLRACGPFSSVLLDLPDFRAQRNYGVCDKPCFIPLDAAEEVTYRTELRNADLDMLLYCELPSLRRLRFLDAYVPPRDQEEMKRRGYAPHYKRPRDPRDYVEALSLVIAQSPRLSELEIWSANVELPARLRLPEADMPVHKLAFHYTGGDRDETMDSLSMSHLRLRIPEVSVYTSPSIPTTMMADMEELNWEDGEW